MQTQLNPVTHAISLASDSSIQGSRIVAALVNRAKIPIDQDSDHGIRADGWNRTWDQSWSESKDDESTG